MATRSTQVADELREVMRTIKRRVRAESADQALSWPQVSLLRRLEQDGAMTTADLARAEVMTPQTMGALVAELVEAGHVLRTDDASDGRRRLLSLTAAGKKALAEGRAARHRWLEQAIEEKLDANEQRALLAALGMLRRVVEGSS